MRDDARSRRPRREPKKKLCCTFVRSPVRSLFVLDSYFLLVLSRSLFWLPVVSPDPA